MKVLFQEKVSLMFSDCDPQGILFFGRVFEVHHKALEKFMLSTHLGWDFWFKNEDLSVPIRNCNCEYLAPLLAGHEYEVRLMTKNVGESSVNLISEISCAQKVCARAETVHVFVDRKTFQKMNIPDPIKSLL